MVGASIAFGSVGCQLVLDIPSDSAKLEPSVRITCQCELLLQQGDEFGEQCDASVEGLDEAGLVSAAEQGCTQCSSGDIQACYALITDAKDADEACSTSPECQSWACCGEPRLGEASVQLDDGAAFVCSQVGCATCQSALDALEAGQPMPSISGESVLLLEQLLTCAEVTKGAPLCTQQCTCDGVGPVACAAACLSCIHDEGACPDERTACSSDQPRPIAREEQ